jgi:hypothetical protein
MMDNALAPAPSHALQDSPSPPAIGDWLDAAAAQVEHDVVAMIDRHAKTQRQADLLRAILRGALAARGAEAGVCRVAMRLLLLVHAAKWFVYKHGCFRILIFYAAPSNWAFVGCAPVETGRVPAGSRFIARLQFVTHAQDRGDSGAEVEAWTRWSDAVPC